MQYLRKACVGVSFWIKSVTMALKELIYHFNVNLKYTSNTLSILNVFFLQVYIKYTLSILQSHFRSILQVYFTKKWWCLFRVHLSQWTILWIEFNWLKAAELQWRLIFNQQFPRNPWYSLDWPLKDERLMQFFSYLMVLNLGLWFGKPVP